MKNLLDFHSAVSFHRLEVYIHHHSFVSVRFRHIIHTSCPMDILCHNLESLELEYSFLWSFCKQFARTALKHFRTAQTVSMMHKVVYEAVENVMKY